MTNFSANGYKLAHFEVLNWGIFDRQIHRFDVDEKNGLLTGDIGSGKSTLIDALTTLLVPPKKLSFNLAAGAKKDERSFDSYFFGYYTSKADNAGRSRSVGLRPDGRHISVLLAHFHHADMGKDLTLAMVFHYSSKDARVARFHLTCEGRLSIEKDFTEFGGSIKELKKALKHKGVQEHTSFTSYAQEFSKVMGLKPDLKALELFNRTISMKSIGSVTEFTRENILERPDIEAEIEKLTQSYEQISLLHEAISVAKDKIAKLEPIVTYGKQAKAMFDEADVMFECKDAVEPYVALQENEELEVFLKKKRQELVDAQKTQRDLEHSLSMTEGELSRVKSKISQAGGSRLEELSSLISEKKKHLADKQKMSEVYLRLCASAKIESGKTASGFQASIDEAREELEGIISRDQVLRDQDRAMSSDINKAQTQRNEIEEEIEQLNRKRSNIDGHLLRLRSAIAEGLGIDETEMPFVGELLKVKESEVKWQGAIERVMRNFALSMLVPEHLYSDVAHFVNSNHLKGRLVYYRVTDKFTDNYQSGSDLLCNKIEIKHVPGLVSWLEFELHRRFNHACCDSVEQFSRHKMALTITGQIKTGGGRHEKDDRFNIHDASRYVLGWDNAEKKKALEAKVIALNDTLHSLRQKLTELEKERDAMQKISRDLSSLANFNFTFEDCDWSAVARVIESLEKEYESIYSKSETLTMLNDKLNELEGKLAKENMDLRGLLRESGAMEEFIKGKEAVFEENTKKVEHMPQEDRDRFFPMLDDISERIKRSKNEAILNAGIRSNLPIKEKLRVWMNNTIQQRRSSARTVEGRMQNAVQIFFQSYYEESTDLDASLASLPEFELRLNTLKEDDLPRHEETFKSKMQEETIRHMGLFNNQLIAWRDEAVELIDRLNEVIGQLNYNKDPETYIKIRIDDAQDEEIRGFLQDMRSVLSYMDEGDLYTETRFHKIQALIEKMKSDERWRTKVTDIRNWLRFSAVEHYRHDDEQKEAYSDSGGKSGGQKEKLAYLCLASAIILKYGLLIKEGTRTSRRPRFNLVIIDEAFIRGSKESTRFGLELFKSLGLQLILVTPLMKLDIISQYISTVGYVDKSVSESSEERSRVFNMSIKQYEEMKLKRSQLHAETERKEDDPGDGHDDIAESAISDEASTEMPEQKDWVSDVN